MVAVIGKFEDIRKSKKKTTKKHNMVSVSTRKNIFKV